MRYSPQGSVIDVTLNADNFIVRDNGPGVTPRLWRELANASIAPPDKPLPAVDLGYRLSKRMAKLHRMNVEFGNAEQGGFEAKVSW
ncbi:hypothetical protein ACLK1V_16540 [Escherichia coli]